MHCIPRRRADIIVTYSIAAFGPTIRVSIDLDVKKCVFGRSQVKFLGLRAPGGENCTVQVFPQPTTVKEKQGFLGTINFFPVVCPRVAHALVPLTNALCGGIKGKSAIG
jgi:hypothetical protein